MTSEFLQGRITRLLEQAAEALDRLDWAEVRARAGAVLRFDASNADTLALLAAAGPAGETENRGTGDERVAQAPSPAAPQSFANGRYTVKRFLGEGGKKRVYLAHDTMLARDVAFALIKTEGLDAEGRERITREAQAMGKLGTHPHVVAVFDIGEEPGSAGILPAGVGEGGGTPLSRAELMAGGDVEGLLEKHRGAPAPSPVVGGPGVPAGEPDWRLRSPRLPRSLPA